MSIQTIPVAEYAEKLLAGRDSMTTTEMPFNGDFDYVMLLMLMASYNEGTSPYIITFTEETVKFGRYTIPLMTISRR